MRPTNLVLVRAGAHSLHERWLEPPPERRDYELVVSFYDEDAFARFTPADGVSAVLVRGGKWDGLFHTLRDIDLDAYEYFWLPDDDLSASAEDVNSLFRLCREHGLTVAQPALTRDSHYSHFIFSQCPGFRLRYTNYIEIMAPCLHRDILKRALPLFRDTMSGFGLDYVWCRWPESGAFRAAILDGIAIHHTRPVGRVLQSAMAAAGRATPEVEEERLKREFALTRRTVPLAFAGLLDDGRPVAGRIAMGLRMCRIWWQDRAAFRDPRAALRGIVKTARRQLTKPLDMSLLDAKDRSAGAGD